MKAIKFWCVSFSLFLCSHAQGQDLDSDLSKFFPFIQGLNQFSKHISQEKVYLHFDNTSYYQGDNIWFKCYVTSAQNQLSPLSKTLYVELLNPGGEVIDKRILRIENGQCHGDFSLNRFPFYSVFYEVRAYTKYMLNFGEDVIFSRLLPVFDRPKTESDFDEKKMLSYGGWQTSRYPMKRERPERGRDVNLRFFPEGGHLVQGVASRIAFEATDANGNPIDVKQLTMDNGQLTVFQIITLHEGKGIFTYTPSRGTRRDYVETEYEGRRYRFDLPAALPQGVVMEVDNLSYPDSIGIKLQKNADTPSEMLGVALLSGGKPQKYYFARIGEETVDSRTDRTQWPASVSQSIDFRMDKTMLSAGVSQIVLFDSQGEVICDRLIFTGRNDLLNISATTAQTTYRPYEPVTMEFTVTDHEMNPVSAPFSLSVRDGANEVESHHNILTDLLLMSEIKGYVRNPAYYFEDDDETRRAALDVLLMVQGWRRYSWKQIAGMEPFELQYLPEQSIEMQGQILATPLIGKPAPKPDVDVLLFLLQRKEEKGEEEDRGSAVETAVTDRTGRFTIEADVEGRWYMILSASENGKPKNYQILLDRLFSPAPKRYNYAELQVSLSEDNAEQITAEETVEEIEEEDNILVAYADSMSRLGINEKIHNLSEIIVTAPRRTREQVILHNRSTSVVYYDVQAEQDSHYDSGGYTGKDIQQILLNMSLDFRYFRVNYEVEGSMKSEELLLYKTAVPLFVINYEMSKEPVPKAYKEFIGPSNLPIPLNLTNASRNVFVQLSTAEAMERMIWELNPPNEYKTINTNAIKAIYINENQDIINQYADSRLRRFETELYYSCAVFIETYEDETDIAVDDAKGVRKTWLEGYSMVREFYSPNYSTLPTEPDYRRTLYWNPMVTPDETGMAKVQFYNNNRTVNLKISVETITSQGLIGIYGNQ